MGDVSDSITVQMKTSKDVNAINANSNSKGKQMDSRETQSTKLNMSFSGMINETTIENYETAGLCEQNYCLCFTHSVDIITFLVATLVGRTEHKRIFVWRLIIALISDILIPILFISSFVEPYWPILSCQIGLSSLILLISLCSLFQESPSKISCFSLALCSPLLCIFKIFIRCSNNLFCREDQVNTAQYLSHRPLFSLYFAHVSKSAILLSEFVAFSVTLGLTVTKENSNHYYIIGAFYILDMLRSSYQAIVAENNHNTRANRYADDLLNRQVSSDHYKEKYNNHIHNHQDNQQIGMLSSGIPDYQLKLQQNQQSSADMKQKYKSNLIMPNILSPTLNYPQQKQFSQKIISNNKNPSNVINEIPQQSNLEEGFNSNEASQTLAINHKQSISGIQFNAQMNKDIITASKQQEEEEFKLIPVKVDSVNGNQVPFSQPAELHQNNSVLHKTQRLSRSLFLNRIQNSHLSSPISMQRDQGQADNDNFQREARNQSDALPEQNQYYEINTLKSVKKV